MRVSFGLIDRPRATERGMGLAIPVQTDGMMATSVEAGAAPLQSYNLTGRGSVPHNGLPACPGLPADPVIQ